MSAPTFRAPLGPPAVAAVALFAGVARWLWQGSGNLYTAAEKRFYVPDPDFGWRVADNAPPWLGLDLLAGLFGLTLALIAAALLIARRERARGARWTPPRAVLWVAGALALTVPIWAFAGGMGPADGRESLPSGDISAPTGTVEGTLAGLPAGTYQLVPADGSAITARVTAGGESFDTRFSGNLAGTLSFDPADLTAPISARIRVDAASVDTGVSMRSKHARSEDFLHAERYPEITFELNQLDSARQGDDPTQVVFWAQGAVTLMDQRLPLAVTGTVRALDDDARSRLGLSAPSLVIDAGTTLLISSTPLSPDDFDADEIPVRVTLIMTHQ
ncbi:YceI family protein [Haliangium sp.]|uniref:YceI family protein n=1 Tax=Haliangium sp. TaxID=2663208 RepID=UPI003D10B6FE